MIKQITLQNFRSHTNTNLLLGMFNVFAGPMGSGKSSVCHALSLIFTGQDPIVNAKGEGLRRETRLGEKEYHIALATDQGTVIDRKVTESKHLLGIDAEYGTLSANQGRIFERFHCSGEIMQALLDPTQFFRRDEKAQRKTLLQFMSAQEVEAPAIVKQLGLASSFKTASQIDALIKEVKDSKVRDLNREIDTLQKQICPPVTVQTDRKKSLETLLKELKPRRDELIRREAYQKEWQRELAALEERVRTTPKEFVLQEKLTFLEAQEKDLQAALGGRRKEYKKKKDAVDEGKQTVSSVNAKADALRSVLATVERMGEKCGVAEIFSCPLPEKDRKTMGEGLRERLKQVENDLDVLGKAVARSQTDLSTAESKGASAAKSLSEVTAQKSSLAAELSSAKTVYKQLAEHKASAPEIGNWAVEISQVSEKIASAEIELLALNRQQEEAAQRAIQVAQVQTKQTQADQFAQAAEELAELKDRLLKDSSGGLVATMQEFVRNFGFREVGLSLEPLGFYLDGIFADQLSAGQQVVVAAALRLAAAKASGFGIMALDDANKLGERSREKMANLLYNSGVQCFVCSTTEIRPMRTPANGYRTFWFTNLTPTGPTSVEELR